MHVFPLKRIIIGWFGGITISDQPKLVFRVGILLSLSIKSGGPSHAIAKTCWHWIRPSSLSQPVNSSSLQLTARCWYMLIEIFSSW